MMLVNSSSIFGIVYDVFYIGVVLQEYIIIGVVYYRNIMKLNKQNSMLFDKQSTSKGMWY